MRKRAIDARIQIGGVLFASQEWNVSEQSQLLDMSNTEGIPTSYAVPGIVPNAAGPPGPGVGLTQLGSSAKLADVPVARVTIRNMTYDDLQNPFVAPIILSIGRFYNTTIWPGGLLLPTGQPGYTWGFPSLCIGQIDHGGRIPGAQPVTIHGENDGGYFEPWQSVIF